MESPSAAPLSFEAWAALSAVLQKKSAASRDTLLAEAGVTSDAFASADRRYRAQLDAELARGKTARAERYAALCAAEAERARALELEQERRARPAPPNTVVEAPLEPVKVEVAVPTFLREGTRAPVAIAFTPDPTPAGSAAGATADLGDLDLSEPLPFAPASEAAAAPPAPAPEPPAPSSSAGATVDVTDLASSLTPATPTPPETIQGLTVQQYACLCAELAAYPDYASTVLHRYSVRAAARRELDAAWAVELEAHPSLKSQFRQAYERYTVWMRSSQKSGV